MPTEMSKKKPTKKKQPLKLISPLLLVLFVSAILLTGIIATIFGHMIGYQNGISAAQHKAEMSNENQNLSSQEIKALNVKAELLDKQLNTITQERDISLNNLELLRNDMKAIEIENLQLKQLSDVYAEALIDQGGLPLEVIAAKIEPLPENAFEYRFDVAMLNKDGKAHRLEPKLTLLNEESLVEVPLEPSHYSIKGVARIRGRFMMPKGFTPAQIRLNLSVNGQNIERIYDWQFSKPVDKMPMSLTEVPETDQRPVTAE